MKRRSFSLMLARRYLNPRRSMLSSFSIISLVGVLLGVLVLVVVMAVYAGMERDVKTRLLGFTPHVLLRHRFAADDAGAMDDWRATAERAKQVPGVIAATPFVTGMVLMDGRGSGSPQASFRGIDTTDPVQVKGIADMLALEAHPDSSADMGLDERVVISSLLAENLNLQVGDRLRLISGANGQKVMDAYQEANAEPLRKAHAEVWDCATGALAGAWRAEGAKWSVPLKTLEEEVYNPLKNLLGESLRKPESVLLTDLLISMERKEIDDDGGVVRFTAEEKAAVVAKVEEINTTDPEKMDAEILKDIKSLVLPREVTVIGVYQASMMVITPDIFAPLSLAQDLAGTEGGVQGVALRLEDAYQAEQAAAAVREAFGPDWLAITWGDQFQAFFLVINQQRGMLYFALSFIVLVSAFSMMAVMFTVTIQKRREIGVMKALGAAPGQIVRVFLYQGMLLGVLGALLGVLLGRVVIHFRGPIQAVFRSMGFDPFSMVTGSTLLPAYNDPEEQALIALMGFALCALAAFVPAFFAARSDAAKSLRNL